MQKIAFLQTKFHDAGGPTTVVSPNINLLSAPFLKLINGICLFFCLLAGNLQPNFQIALTYSILKLKSILIPPDKMT